VSFTALLLITFHLCQVFFKLFSITIEAVIKLTVFLLQLVLIVCFCLCNFIILQLKIANKTEDLFFRKYFRIKYCTKTKQKLIKGFISPEK